MVEGRDNGPSLTMRTVIWPNPEEDKSFLWTLSFVQWNEGFTIYFVVAISDFGNPGRARFIF